MGEPTAKPGCAAKLCSSPGWSCGSARWSRVSAGWRQEGGAVSQRGRAASPLWVSHGSARGTGSRSLGCRAGCEACRARRAAWLHTVGGLCTMRAPLGSSVSGCDIDCGYGGCDTWRSRALGSASPPERESRLRRRRRDSPEGRRGAETDFRGSHCQMDGARLHTKSRGSTHRRRVSRCLGRRVSPRGKPGGISGWLKPT